MKLWHWIERIAHWIGLLLGILAIVAVGVIIGRPSEKSGNQPNFAGAEQQKKRLAVFLDGTWNSVNSNTNVWRMRALCTAKSADGKPQLVYYEIGVNGFLGGVFGQGLDENIRLAYEWLVENYNDGDEIFIFGFSRGAFTARSLAGLIAIQGILKAGSPIGVTELFDRYKKGNEESIWKLKEVQASGDTSKLTEQERWLLKYSQPADVKVVGVWDTVGSVGVAAGNISGISRSEFDYLQTGLRIHILNGYHALAIDEHRPDFAPTIWDVRHPKDPNTVVAQPRPLSGVEQRWFVGAHANVGGGYETDLLAQAPLRWMMKKAESHGLSFRSEVDLDGDAVTAPTTDSYNSFFSGWYAKVFPPLYRTIGREPDVRETEATSISTRRSTPTCSSGGVPIQRIARRTLSSGHSASRLIPRSSKLPCGLMILTLACQTRRLARDIGGVRLLLCRFSDAGMQRSSTRSGGRRPKSAKARNRGVLGTDGAAGYFVDPHWVA